MNIQVASLIGIFLITVGGAVYIKVLQADLRAVKAEIKLSNAEKASAIRSFNQCIEDQKITSEVSNDYQNQLSASNAELDYFRGDAQKPHL